MHTCEYYRILKKSRKKCKNVKNYFSVDSVIVVCYSVCTLNDRKSAKNRGRSGGTHARIAIIPSQIFL